MEKAMEVIETGRIIAAVKTEEEFECAVNSDIAVIFDLSPDLLTIAKRVAAAHEKDKKILIHLDLATGIGRDKSGIQYVKNIGVDGIISTRANIIKFAKETGLYTIQRFFIVDSKSLDTAVDAVNSIKPEMIEIMPGIAVKAISKIKTMVTVPIIAGGLIENSDEVNEAVSSGATAISTGKKELWG